MRKLIIIAVLSMLLCGCASTMTNYKNYMESGKLGADLGAYTDDAFTFSLLFY
jgi:uncharacterized protein YcfL